MRRSCGSPGKLPNNLTTVGVGNTRILIKTDTDPAIIDLRNKIEKTRSDVPTGFDDSRVGDSNSNECSEGGVRDVKGLKRISRSALQRKMVVPIDLESSIVPLIVRHAGYILIVAVCTHAAGHRCIG